MQLLQPLLGGYLRTSRWCPLKRGFIVLNWKIFGYFSLHFRWVIHRPVKIAIGNGSEKSYTYSLALHPVLSKGVAYARLPAMRPAVSNPGVDAICRLSLLLVLSLSPRGFSPGSSVPPSPLKPTLSNSNSIWNAGTCFNEFLTTSRCSVGKQITPKNWPQLLKR